MNKDKQLGIIREPGIGCRDFHDGVVGLWFTVATSECSASLQCFFGDQIAEILAGYRVYDVKDLAGKPCWVREDGAMIRWVGPCIM